MACAGDMPTLEALAATALLRGAFLDLRVRFINVVDLMRLQPIDAHPHGLDDAAFDAYFTTDTPVVFAYHGYPAIVHRYTYDRSNHDNFHVHGFIEEGTTTTPSARRRLTRQLCEHGYAPKSDYALTIFSTSSLRPTGGVPRS